MTSAKNKVLTAEEIIIKRESYLQLREWRNSDIIEMMESYHQQKQKETLELLIEKILSKSNPMRGLTKTYDVVDNEDIISSFKELGIEK